MHLENIRKRKERQKLQIGGSGNLQNSCIFLAISGIFLVQIPPIYFGRLKFTNKLMPEFHVASAHIALNFGGLLSHEFSIFAKF